MKRDEVEEFLAASTGPLDVTPVDIMAAIAAFIISVPVVLVAHAIGRRRRSLRERTRRDRPELERETPAPTKRKV